jgi:two-component system OmpR family sensor kinase
LTFLTLEQERKNKDELLDIKKIIQDRVEYFDILAKSKQIDFKLLLDDIKVVMDRRKFTRLLDNLISNAIKYNKRNGTVTIILKEKILVIEDTGIGISEENIPFMFDRYLRFNSSEGGFGVGLSIVKKIIDEYGWKISTVSEKEKGTRIEIRW